MNIKQNSVVAVTYDLYTTENDQEVFVEKADEQNPLVFLYGQGMMLPKFEENLGGLTVGDTYDFELSAADAYGEKDESAITDLPINMFEGMDKPEVNSIFNPLTGLMVNCALDTIRLVFWRKSKRSIASTPTCRLPE